jgi:hypothetical protein
MYTETIIQADHLSMPFPKQPTLIADSRVQVRHRRTVCTLFEQRRFVRLARRPPRVTSRLFAS